MKTYTDDEAVDLLFQSVNKHGSMPFELALKRMKIIPALVPLVSTFPTVYKTFCYAVHSMR